MALSSCTVDWPTRPYRYHKTWLFYQGRALKENGACKSRPEYYNADASTPHENTRSQLHQEVHFHEKSLHNPDSICIPIHVCRIRPCRSPEPRTIRHIGEGRRNQCR